jgi:hypothetical protein
VGRGISFENIIIMKGAHFDLMYKTGLTEPEMLIEVKNPKTCKIDMVNFLDSFKYKGTGKSVTLIISLEPSI